MNIKMNSPTSKMYTPFSKNKNNEMIEKNKMIIDTEVIEKNKMIADNEVIGNNKMIADNEVTGNNKMIADNEVIEKMKKYLSLRKYRMSYIMLFQMEFKLLIRMKIN
ncbi:hypothetical protein [Bacillus paramycoides]|uniref:hypothetical protein n=1 Tax=Bacillus paramycoides TaxID=2026194 RepID=UPI002E249D73|nr:hypothetical protein [Bacillus paramycoides]